MSLVILELWKLLKVPKRWHGKRNKVCIDTLLLLSILKTKLPKFGFCHGLYSNLASTMTLHKDSVPTSVVVVQLLNHVRLFATPWTAAHQASLSFTISQGLFKLMSTEPVMPSNHLILCCPPFLLPLVFLSINIFSSELALHIRWPNYWSCSFSINPLNEYSELISFRIDWFNLLAVQGTLKNLLQHHNLKASIQPKVCVRFFSSPFPSAQTRGTRSLRLDNLDQKQHLQWWKTGLGTRLIWQESYWLSLTWTISSSVKWTQH